MVIGHALNNALIPVITVSGMGFCNLLGGMVFVEKIFPGRASGNTPIFPPLPWIFPAICGVPLLIAVTYVVVNHCSLTFFTV